jgi:hypothetical protein
MQRWEEVLNDGGGHPEIQRQQELNRAVNLEDAEYMRGSLVSIARGATVAVAMYEAMLRAIPEFGPLSIKDMAVRGLVSREYADEISRSFVVVDLRKEQERSRKFWQVFDELVDTLKAQALEEEFGKDPGEVGS